MADEFERAAAYLPPALHEAVRRAPTALRMRAQEIRLRVNAPLVLSAGTTDWALHADGGVCERADATALLCTPADIQACFQRLCDYSVHSHQQELCRGYIATADGCRAGVAGTAVTENGHVLSVRNITSLCLRIARRHEGCAADLVRRLTAGGYVRATLIGGEPASGKTSLLRDAAAQLSARFRVAVIDERGELSGGGGLGGCDVLRHCPKAVGVEQAVRCLSPDAVLFDELGSAEELNAVIGALHSGVAAVTTVHCREPAQLLRRRGLAEALRAGVFEQVVLLAGRGEPGRIARVLTAEELLR